MVYTCGMQKLNQELVALNLPVIHEVEMCPERAEYLAHLAEESWGDEKWVKKLNRLKAAYKLAFHNYVAEVYPFLRFELGEDKNYWNYTDEGVYEEVNYVTVRGLVIKLLIEEDLADATTDSFAKNCLARYRAMFPERGSDYNDFDTDDIWFHAANGWVNLETLEFTPHTPQRLSRRKSAVAYNPEAKCPVYDSFLDTEMQLKQDQVRVIDQFSGLCLTGDIHHQKMLTFIGRPGSGKSTLLNSWTHVLGDLAIERKLTELQGESMRFAGSSFVGSTLCWFDEVDVKKAEMGNALGTIITGEHINVERKGINGIIKTRNSVKCVLTANRLPNTAELGIYRRIILINLSHSFSDSETARLDMADKLKEEASGILNRMIRGLHDLRKMGTFTMISGHADLIEEYKAQSDTIAEFLDTYFVPGDEDDVVETTKLLEAYRHFTLDKTFGILTPQKFGRLIASQPLTRFSHIKPKKGIAGVRCWSGLRLAPEWRFHGETNAIESVFSANF